MIRVSIIGGGKVANHLINAFLGASNIQLIEVFVRNTNKLKEHKSQINITSNLQKLKDADLYIIAVSDDAIEEISSKISVQGLVVHTSGAVSLKAISNTNRRGVFYLLQSFSNNKKVDFKEVPFCLETEKSKDLKLLEEVALAIGQKIYHIDSKQRSYLHVAAVFVNNFTNHLYSVGNEICKENNIPFGILFPLIEETAAKVAILSPEKAQTGPALRNDINTIKKHLNVLDDKHRELYKTITESIINGKKL